MNKSFPLQPDVPVRPLGRSFLGEAEACTRPGWTCERDIVPVSLPRNSRAHGLLSLRRVQDLAARLIPHGTARVVCPPGPIPTGPQPPIVVSSLMRSGTHLVMDLVLNNLQGYRQDPLYIDFDSYVYEGYSTDALRRAGSTVVKTHFAQRPFTAAAADSLLELASRGAVIIPVRKLADVQRSMAKWGYRISQADLAAQHQQQLDFWNPLNPLLIDFDDLLDAGKAPGFLAALRQRLALPALPQDTVPVMAGDSRPRNLWRKLRTRLQASNAPVINTTVGFKL